MSLYLDASVLVPTVVVEQASPAVGRYSCWVARTI